MVPRRRPVLLQLYGDIVGYSVVCYCKRAINTLEFSILWYYDDSVDTGRRKNSPNHHSSAGTGQLEQTQRNGSYSILPETNFDSRRYTTLVQMTLRKYVTPLCNEF